MIEFLHRVRVDAGQRGQVRRVPCLQRRHARGHGGLEAERLDHLELARSGVWRRPERIGDVAKWLEAIDLVLLRSPVLTRAAEPLPTPLGTLDTLHLATALVWRDRMGSALVVATHDETLALTARAFRFQVIGA
jgi:hypothetical protein